jgi:hypothetical protein
MRKRRPDHRYRDVSRVKEAPRDPLEAALWRLMCGETTENQTVEWAYDIYKEIREREVLQACLIARATEAEISNLLRVPPEVTRAFRHLFFDIEAFRDELHLLSWIDDYVLGREGTTYGAQLLRTAITAGFDGLRWIFGRGQVLIEPQDVLHRVMTDAYFRGALNRGQSISSDEAKAALTLLKTATGVAISLNKKGSAKGLNDVIFKLMHRDDTTPVTDIGAEDVPLH